MSDSSNPVAKLEHALFALLPWLAIAALWLLNFNYLGLVHDAVLYTIEAISHAHPELYSGDIFLRHGSQGSFTLFTPFLSLLIDKVGPEPAAAFATLLSLAALLYLAWRLARVVSSPPLALFGLAFLLTLPNDFGPRSVFHFLEGFITPRMPAEALVLGALLAFFSDRRWLAVVLLVASTAIHPLMGAPGAVIVAYLWLAPRRPWLLPIVAAIGLVALAAIGSLPLLDSRRIDAEWRAVIDSYAEYLFVSSWSALDWIRAATTVTSLALGARFLPATRARQLCAGALFAGFAGFAVALIGTDWLQLAIVMQGQGYRWLWPASLLAVLLLPAISHSLWQAGTAGRGTVFALATLWLSRSEPLAPLALATVVLFAVVTARANASARTQRWMLWGAAGLFGLAVLFKFANDLLANANGYYDTIAPAIVDQARTFAGDGFIPIAIFLGVFFINRMPARRMIAGGTAVALLAACLLLLPSSLAGWTRREHDAQLFEQFAEWRTLIPPRSEVVWIDEPLSIWLSLQRPSYYSSPQTGSAVFSRDTALELRGREKSLVPFALYTGLAKSSDYLRKLVGDLTMAPQTLAEVCAVIDARFIVSRADLRALPLATAPHGVPLSYRTIRLYRCDDSASIRLPTSHS